MAGIKILVVEDEGIVAKDIERSLCRMGHEVAGICASGEEAIAFVEKTKLDLILMDIVLAGELDGTEAATIIRQRFQLPIIYITAYTDSETLKRARHAEPFAYIPKPFEERELHAAVEMAIYKSGVEKELKEREEWLATTLRCIGDGVIATDCMSRVLFINHVAVAWTGWSAEKAQNKSLQEVFNIVWEASKMPGKNPVKKCLDLGQIYNISRPTLLISRDGAQRPVEYNASPIRSAEGAIMGAVLAFRDISEKQRTEEALRRSEEQLRQSQKMDAVGRLAGGIAHDFNNMLTAILGYSRLALDERDDSNAIREDLHQIMRTGERAADLTKQLLAFSRSQALPICALDLNEAVKEATGLLSRTITSNIDLDVALDEEILGVKAEMSQLQQLIMNLAINARDAMAHGGRLSIRTSQETLDDESCIKRGVDKPGDYVLLRVGDTGCGMPQEVIDHVFEPFFTTKEQGKGTGLGLSTVYGIVKQFKGFIAIDSELDRGTTFAIYLPLIDAPVLVEDDNHETSLPLGVETILLVEDEEIIINLASRVLKSLGYSVLEARDGLAAQELSRTYDGEIHLMITDLVMPRMGGYQLAENLSRERPAMKVLLISGYTEEAISHHGGLDPDTPFLPKPFEPRTLALKVRSVLDYAVRQPVRSS